VLCFADLYQPKLLLRSNRAHKKTQHRPVTEITKNLRFVTSVKNGMVKSESIMSMREED
jgi:hypothetical protein